MAVVEVAAATAAAVVAGALGTQAVGIDLPCDRRVLRGLPPAGSCRDSPGHGPGRNRRRKRGGAALDRDAPTPDGHCDPTGLRMNSYPADEGRIRDIERGRSCEAVVPSPPEGSLAVGDSVIFAL